MPESKTTTEELDGKIEALAQEKAAFIIKLMHHSNQVSRDTIQKAIDLANSMSCFHDKY